MEQDESWVPSGVLLPVTLTPDFRPGFDIKLPSHAGRQAGKFAPPKGSGNGHQVTVAERLGRYELFHDNLC
jgi:hypothetical protein